MNTLNVWGSSPLSVELGASAYVVASDAPVDQRNWARFLSAVGERVWLCDGVADNVDINEAIADAPSENSVIRLLGNIFNISASVIMNVDKMTLEGQSPMAAIFRLANGVNDDVIKVTLGTVLPTIRNINIEGNRANQTAGHGINSGGVGLTIEYVCMSNAYQDGIHQEGAVGTTASCYVRKCLISNSGRYNLYGHYCHDSWFIDDIFGEATESNVLISSNNLVFDGCNIFSAGWNGATWVGDHQNINIVGDYNKIINCFLNDASARAIQAEDSEGLIISHNTLLSNNRSATPGYPDIYVGANVGNSSAIITENDFSGATHSYYVQTVESGGFHSSFIIQNNLVSGAAWGDHGFNIPLDGANIVSNNLGAIMPGEIRKLYYSITAGVAGTITSKDNPLGQDVALVTLDVRLVTPDADAPNIDAGVGANPATSYSTLFNDLPGETAGFYRSTAGVPGAQTVPILWQSGAGNRYLNLALNDNDGSSIVGTFIVTIMGV